MTTDQRPILVVVPDDDAGAILRYAAWEALVHGCPLELVHAYRPADEARAEHRVADAVDEAGLLAGPGVPVTGHAVSGTPASSVVSTGAGAGLVVVPRRDAPALVNALEGEGFTIASVPPGWTVRPDDQRPVLLGVADPAGAPALVARGLEIARVHEAPLRVLYSWHARDSYEAELLDEAREARALVLARGPEARTLCRVLPESPCPVVLLP
ncbi:MAG TPA: universal stress protein [Nocardioides sp.]|nr:universal stress protein [Nocardioides sp.]